MVAIRFPPTFCRANLRFAATADERSKCEFVLATRARPRVAITPQIFRLEKIKGGGAPEGATVPWGHATHRMLPPKCASGATARSSERARLSALHRGACLGHVPKLDPGRASRDAVRRR